MLSQQSLWWESCWNSQIVNLLVVECLEVIVVAMFLVENVLDRG